MQTTDYTVDQVPELFRSLRERMRKDLALKEGLNASGSAVRQLEFPGFEPPALAAWDPVQALGGLITRNAAVRRMERRPA